MATTPIHPSTRGNPVAHDHSHDYRSAGKRALLVVLGLIGCLIAIETIGGILSGSLGLLAHATHVITDAVAICLALFAMWISERPATISRTFGFQRIEVLVVVLNAIALFVLATWIFYGAYQRFTGHAHGHEHELDGGTMLMVAIAGLAINAIAAWTLYRASGHSINVEGAFWHIIADLAGSVAVLISSILIYLYDWDLVDPMLSVLIGTLILAGSFRLAMKVVRILMEDTPAGVDVYMLCSKIEDMPGVTLVHDVHVWTITTDYNALSAHVVVDPDYLEDVEQLMRNIHWAIHEDFDIQHITLQMEHSAIECFEHHHVDHLQARSLQES